MADDPQTTETPETPATEGQASQAGEAQPETHAETESKGDDQK